VSSSTVNRRVAPRWVANGLQAGRRWGCETGIEHTSPLHLCPKRVVTHTGAFESERRDGVPTVLSAAFEIGQSYLPGLQRWVAALVAELSAAQSLATNSSSRRRLKVCLGSKGCRYRASEVT
jgi:hypothetical protein